MYEHERAGPVPPGPFGYATCGGCGAAVQRRLLEHAHRCDPEHYLRHQASRLHWTRHGFDDALHSWLATPAGRFAQYYARRLVSGRPAMRPGEAT